jgi:hypothetical protein
MYVNKKYVRSIEHEDLYQNCLMRGTVWGPITSKITKVSDRLGDVLTIAFIFSCEHIVIEFA